MSDHDQLLDYIDSPEELLAHELGHAYFAAIEAPLLWNEIGSDPVLKAQSNQEAIEFQNAFHNGPPIPVPSAMNWRAASVTFVVACGSSCRPSSPPTSHDGGVKMSTVVDLESHQIIQFVDQNWSDVLVTDNVDPELVRRAFRRHRNKKTIVESEVNPGVRQSLLF